MVDINKEDSESDINEVSLGINRKSRDETYDSDSGVDINDDDGFVVNKDSFVVDVLFVQIDEVSGIDVNVEPEGRRKVEC